MVNSWVVLGFLLEVGEIIYLVWGGNVFTGSLRKHSDACSPTLAYLSQSTRSKHLLIIGLKVSRSSYSTSLIFPGLFCVGSWLLSLRVHFRVLHVICFQFGLLEMSLILVYLVRFRYPFMSLCVDEFLIMHCPRALMTTKVFFDRLCISIHSSQKWIASVGWTRILSHVIIWHLI